MKDRLPVSEIFYSIQGEGSTHGRPSVFLRLGGCNLSCGSNSSAKWKCDTLETWKSSKVTRIDDLAQDLVNQYKEALSENVTLVITGGEPMLYQHALSDLCNILTEKLEIVPRIEVETNGTIEPEYLFNTHVLQYNVSPKLSSSGEEKSKRYNLQALQKLKETENAIFKFVVLDETDWKEIETDFIEPLSIEKENLWLMPGAQTKEELESTSRFVISMCLHHHVNFSNRLQVQIWDRKKGV